jgi:hypothetical protein
MIKSQVNAVFHVFEGLFLDASRAYPEMKGLDLDMKRLALYAQTRGLAFYTLDLPNLNSLLLRGLESGRLPLEGPLSHAVSKRVRVPRLFRGLWLRVFDRHSCLKLDADSTAIAFLRQFTCLGKSLRVECSLDRRKAALENYHNVERSLRTPTLKWDRDRIDVGRLPDLCFADCIATDLVGSDDLFTESEQGGNTPIQPSGCQSDRRLLETVQSVADCIAGALPFLEPVSYSEILESEGMGIGFKHGRGAVAERQKNWEKSEFLNWPAKLNDWFPYEQCGTTAGFKETRPRNHELASKMSMVPKTAKSPRLIAAEPVAHQWCQQIVWNWLRRQIKSLFGSDFIDFRRQDLSGNMVLSASRSRKLATVDLSDASDRLSCWNVERMFRCNPSLLSCLHAARTRHLKIDNLDGSSSFIKLKKFATQGTATTFPVQSLVFLIIGLAACMTDEKVDLRRIKKHRYHVRTYGDDIIIPTYGYARLIRIMDLLQLKVNTEKSYVTGNYRESCGVDGFMGDDVTPVCPKTLVADSPDSCQAVVDTSNNLFNKGFWNASNNLRSTIPLRIQRGIRTVARSESGFAGFTSFSGSDESHLIKRWNPRLHRWEGRVWRLSPDSRTETRQGRAVFLDFVSRAYSDVNPRIASEYGHVRKVRSNLLWEPLNSGAHGMPSIPEAHERDRFIRGPYSWVKPGSIRDNPRVDGAFRLHLR